MAFLSLILPEDLLGEREREERHRRGGETLSAASVCSDWDRAHSHTCARPGVQRQPLHTQDNAQPADTLWPVCSTAFKLVLQKIILTKKEIRAAQGHSTKFPTSRAQTVTGTGVPPNSTSELEHALSLHPGGARHPPSFSPGSTKCTLGSQDSAPWPAAPGSFLAWQHEFSEWPSPL